MVAVSGRGTVMRLALSTVTGFACYAVLRIVCTGLVVRAVVFPTLGVFVPASAGVVFFLVAIRAVSR